MENIFESYDYKYNGLNRKEIEDKLYAEIMDALHERYGASPDPQILKRVQEEWNAIQQADIVLDATDFEIEQTVAAIARRMEALNGASYGC